MKPSRGDIVWADLPRLNPRRSYKARYALVISNDEHNNQNDYGVVVALSTGAPSQRLPGVYQLDNWQALNLDHESVVVPWLFTVEWDYVTRKASDLAPSQYNQVMERLHEVFEI